MAKPTKFNVTDSEGVSRFVVHGSFADGVLTLKHSYPDFDVEAGWSAVGGGSVLTFTGPREGQTVPCSRG